MRCQKGAITDFAAPLVKKKWSLGADWLIAAGAYHEADRSISSLDRMLVHRRSFPRNLLGFPQQFAGTDLYSFVES